jgi:hypothetical protein
MERLGSGIVVWLGSCATGGECRLQCNTSCDEASGNGGSCRSIASSIVLSTSKSNQGQGGRQQPIHQPWDW